MARDRRHPVRRARRLSGARRARRSTDGWRRPRACCPPRSPRMAATSGIICPAPSGLRGGVGRRRTSTSSRPTACSRWSIISAAISSRRGRCRSAGADPAGPARSQRGARPGGGAPRARSGGGRRPQPPDDRPARRRQVDAGARLPSILPPLNPRELLDVSMIASIAGELAGGAISRPPAVPRAASFGLDGGAGRRRAEGAAGRSVSLAHNGVLFLDELPEFAPAVLDSLRQPLEAGETVIARANARVTYPGALPADRRDEPLQMRHGRHARPHLQARRRLRRRLPGRASRGRSSTASTCASMCPPSPPPT